MLKKISLCRHEVVDLCALIAQCNSIVNFDGTPAISFKQNEKAEIVKQI